MEKVKKQEMESLFVSYELALLAKKKGYRELCFGFYNIQHELDYPHYAGQLENWNSGKYLCSAPLYQQLVDWFREKHNLHFYIDTTAVFDKMYPSQYKFHINVPFQPFKWTTGHYYTEKTYYEALNKALTEAFKLI